MVQQRAEEVAECQLGFHPVAYGAAADFAPAVGLEEVDGGFGGHEMFLSWVGGKVLRMLRDVFTQDP